VKILFVIDSLGFGGAERQLVELVKGLSRKPEYDVHLISLMKMQEGYAEDIKNLDIKLSYFPRKYKWDIIGPILSIRTYILRNKIDVVHTFMNMGSLLGGLAAKLSCRPTVCSAIRDAKDTSLKGRLIKKSVAIFSDIYVSNSYAGFHGRFKKMKPKFKVVYNGMDFSRFETKVENSMELKKDLGIENFQHVVCMVASLSNNRDHLTLLRAVPLVLKQCFATVFLLVGDGPKREIIEETILRSGISKNVILAGYRKDVDLIYKIVDLCLLLTNTDVILEGISNALTEAMINRVPVIASTGGGTNEVIKNGITGLLIPPKNPQGLAKSIVGLLHDSVKREKMALAGQKFVFRQFGSERYIKEYEDLYREL